MKKIVVITNPNAKENSKDPERAARFAHILGKRGLVYETRVPEEIAPLVEQLKSEEMELLAICGGDGTYQRVLTALVNGWGGRPLPRLYMLQGGSMNTIRYSLGGRAPAEESLRLLLHKLDNDLIEQEQRRLLCVNDESYGFIFGFGAPTRFLEDYYSSSSATGPMRAADTLYKCISSIVMRTEYIAKITSPLEAETWIDGKLIEQRAWTMVLAGTVEYIGLGFKPLARARERKDGFALWASGLKPSRILAQIHKMYQGKPLSGPEHVDVAASEVVFKPIEEHAAYTLDGELYSGAGDLRLSVGPEVAIVRE